MFSSIEHGSNPKSKKIKTTLGQASHALCPWLSESSPSSRKDLMKIDFGQGFHLPRLWKRLPLFSLNVWKPFPLFSFGRIASWLRLPQQWILVLCLKDTIPKKKPRSGQQKGSNAHRRKNTLCLIEIYESHSSGTARTKKETDGEQYENISMSCFWNHPKQINMQCWGCRNT